MAGNESKLDLHFMRFVELVQGPAGLGVDRRASRLLGTLATKASKPLLSRVLRMKDDSKTKSVPSRPLFNQPPGLSLSYLASERPHTSDNCPKPLVEILSADNLNIQGISGQKLKLQNTQNLFLACAEAKFRKQRRIKAARAEIECKSRPTCDSSNYSDDEDNGDDEDDSDDSNYGDNSGDHSNHGDPEDYLVTNTMASFLIYS